MGLLAAWREGLLAQKVLEGKTKGYRQHPQLLRFRNSANSVLAIAIYLESLYRESLNRGYSFDGGKINYQSKKEKMEIAVSGRQVEYEFELLKWKLERRNPAQFGKIKDEKEIELNELFRLVEGDMEIWEKTIDEVMERVIDKERG
jgi:hypothetical protein